MKAYFDIVDHVIKHGIRSENRTATDTIAVSGYMFRHKMSDGFPLLTSKQMGIKNIATELEFFIKGNTSKSWLQERGCHIWDEWCNPKVVPYGQDPETLEKMAQEDDLGKIYGFQWREFNGDKEKGDQLRTVIETLKKDPSSRRLVVSAWNPLQLDEMALPPCHVMFEFMANPTTKKLDLMFVMRSCDVGLGLPYNIASYALLLELVAKETGLIPNELIAVLGNTHIYLNHIGLIKEQMEREIHPLPKLAIENWTNIWEWEATDTKVLNYSHSGKLPMPIAI